ncbi:MAG TPA: hypothetical protein VHV10_17765 [Ktedonobacteraceae bacterium]|jgi:hypothetical protein|nr:hypothetical protein [Ktedonobacteraceae bacterium]
MIRHCDGNDPNLIDEDQNPCRCGKTFDDVYYMTVYPHDAVAGGNFMLIEDRINKNLGSAHE